MSFKPNDLLFKEKQEEQTSRDTQPVKGGVVGETHKSEELKALWEDYCLRAHIDHCRSHVYISCSFGKQTEWSFLFVGVSFHMMHNVSAVTVIDLCVSV